jgi:transcriptional regulator with XRE-family HTH domain
METPLRAIRKERKVSIYAVAEAAACSPTTVSRVERGVQNASSDMAERLAKYFDGGITEEQILYPERFKNKKVA